MCHLGNISDTEYEKNGRNKYSNLSNKLILDIWGEGKFASEKDIQDFRKELVKRHFVSLDEINTKWECVERQ